MLARRNVRLGRGDRRGAFRLGVFLFTGGILNWLCRANHVPDLMEFTALAAGLAWAAFTAFGFWMVYMAFEPYVRRRWPHVLISWSRVVAGKFRDPLASGHFLIGITAGTAAVALISMGLAIAGAYSPRRPSSAVLSGMRETVAYVAASVVDAVLYGLFLVFIASFCRALLQKSWLAVPATFVLAGAGALAVELPKSLEPAPEAVIIGGLLATYLFLLYHLGLLATSVACCITMMLIALPITSDISAPTTTNSILVICGVLGCALLTFHATRAGRPIFRVDL
jgi:eukaryotic-like serine/threonine-protein kinase